MLCTVMQEVKDKLSKDYWNTLITELVIWPGYQALNFWKVPLKHQLLVGACTQVSWHC